MFALYTTDKIKYFKVGQLVTEVTVKFDYNKLHTVNNTNYQELGWCTNYGTSKNPFKHAVLILGFENTFSQN